MTKAASGTRFASVWDALSDSPEEAATMKLRSALLMALGQEIKRWDLTQVAAAKRLGVTQPRLNKLLKGHINDFSLDSLVDLAGRAGLEIAVKVSRPKAKAA